MSKSHAFYKCKHKQRVITAAECLGLNHRTNNVTDNPDVEESLVAGVLGVNRISNEERSGRWRRKKGVGPRNSHLLVETAEAATSRTYPVRVWYFAPVEPAHRSHVGAVWLNHK
ncbi:hypothetical protein EVAR_83371_1 [Eumeta japonica]|uniref:Uncharacterized protein n=1 Tax=Eumeta variegata TaxID=151549 RepID=A0A4C1TYD0_EUMVA|nr:hypothetical protein EVAR_83371_1 [Eumeta japonica]